MNKGRGAPLSVGSAVSSFCFSNDLLVVCWKQEVVEDGGALDEPMAKLLSVMRWLSVGSVVSSFCFSDDLLVVRRKLEVVEDGAALDEPMAKLLSVVRWPSIGGGEADPRRRTTA